MDREKLEDLEVYGQIMEDVFANMNVLAKLLSENIFTTRKYIKYFDGIVIDLIKDESDS